MTANRAVIRHLLGTGNPTGESDGELLERFVRHRDQAAVEALVRRHAPMVWGVCRRILRNHHDAEDAFQAAFVVLVRRAASVVPREAVADWLYGVARQTALKARQMLAKRKERQVEAPEPAAPDPDERRALESLLDQELAALPEKYRVPILLCDLEGRTRKEAARQLGCPEGTVAGRLVRARAMLAARLARRGLVVPATLLPTLLSAGVPDSVVRSAVEVIRTGATGPVALLAQGVIQAMLVTKLKLATVVLAALVAAAVWAALPSSRADDVPKTPEAPNDLRGARAKGDPGPKDEVAWGKPENGLRLGIVVAGPGRVGVMVENVGQLATVVNLGILLANGKTQYPTAVRLAFTDAAGKTHRFERLVGGIAGRVDPFVVPLPAGSRYVLPFALAECVDTDNPGVLLAPGEYRVTAAFTGEKVDRTNADTGGLALMPYWTGTLRSGEVTLRVPNKLPGATEKAARFLWGNEVKGLQAGIGFRTDRKEYRIGEEILLQVNVRNVGKEPVNIRYSSARLLHARPEIEDAVGRRITFVGDNRLALPPAVRYVIPQVDGVLKPGEEMTFGLVQLKLAPQTARGGVQTPELRAEPGEYAISYTVPMGADLSPVTGKLKFVARPAGGGE